MKTTTVSFNEVNNELIKRGLIIEDISAKTPLERYQYLLKLIRLTPNLMKTELNFSEMLRNLRKCCLQSGYTQAQLNESLRQTLLNN